MSFADTIKAKSILSKSFRDSVGTELDSAKVSDSVLVMIDSAVSLSQKELLDSMLAELPEYRKTPSGGAFSYPSSILVETNAKVVPFDSTLIAKMEPVIKEPTPYIDGFPTTPPLGLRNEPRIFFEAGVGYPTVPFGTIEGKLVSSSLTSITAGGGFHNNMGTVNAIKNTWNVGANAKHIFMLDSLAADARQPQAEIDVRYDSRERIVRVDSTEPSFEQKFISGRVGLELGELNTLYFKGDLSLSNYSDKVQTNASESVVGFNLLMKRNLLQDKLSEAGMIVSYTSASSESNSFHKDRSIFTIAPQYTFHLPWDSDNTEYTFGFKLNLTNFNGESSAQFSAPFLTMNTYLSNTTQLTASIASNVFINGYSTQAKINPFFSPGVGKSSISGGNSTITNQLNGGGSYISYITPDEYIRFTARGISTTNDVVFALDTNNLFYTYLTDTRRFELEAATALHLFKKDNLTATVSFASTVSQDDKKQLPFVPQLSIQSSYTFASLSKVLMPKVEFTYLGRTERSIALIHAEANYALSQRVSLKLRLENILGSASDYWSGYNEYPRAIMASIRAAF